MMNRIVLITLAGCLLVGVSQALATDGIWTTVQATVNIEPLDSDGGQRDNQQEVGYDCTAPGDPSDLGPVPNEGEIWSNIQALYK